MSINGSTTNSYNFTGRETDGLGINYYRARYYNPTTGRFLSEDPIGFRGGVNRYAYASDNPITLRDPRGLQSTQTGIGGTYVLPVIPVGGTGGLGIATDGLGDVGFYVYAGGGGAVGAGLSGGIQGYISNASTLNDLEGLY